MMRADAPFRVLFGYFRRMIDDLARLPDVVFMTGSEIADWYLSQT